MTKIVRESVGGSPPPPTPSAADAASDLKSLLSTASRWMESGRTIG
jgi:hypothetical protein